MNENNIRKAFAGHDVDKEAIRRAVTARAISESAPRRRVGLKPILAVGVSLMLAAAAFMGLAIAAEAAEYNEAVEFFGEYRLSTEGLTRAEIKAVYKDISLKTYSFEKTIEILNDYNVEFNSSALGTLDPAGLDALWNERNAKMFNGNSDEKSGIWYSADYTEPAPTDENGVPVSEVTIVRHDGEKTLWRYTVPFEMYVFVGENVIVTENGVIVYGQKDSRGTNSGYAYAFMLDNSGELVWEYSDEGIGSEFEAASLSGGELALFGRGAAIPNTHKRLFTVLSLEGAELKRRVSEADSYVRAETAVKVGDYYLVKQYVNGGGIAEAELISISSDGDLIDKFTYSEGGVSYRIEDIASFGGKVYLSALMPNISDEAFDEEFSKLFGEYADKWNSADSESKDGAIIMPEAYNERLNRLFAERYTAVLLVCDENAAITRAYSADNARAGRLFAENGELKWQVMRIDDVKNVSLFISSRCVDILATEFSFDFDEDGGLIGKTEIGAYPMMY